MSKILQKLHRRHDQFANNNDERCHKSPIDSFENDDTQQNLDSYTSDHGDDISSRRRRRRGRQSSQTTFRRSSSSGPSAVLDRRNSRIDIIGINNDDAKTLTVQDLEEELAMLRESTKSALEVSWAEVERVQNENKTLEQNALSLRRELKSEREQRERVERQLASFLKGDRRGSITCSISRKGSQVYLQTPGEDESEDDGCDLTGWHHDSDDDQSNSSQDRRGQRPSQGSISINSNTQSLFSLNSTPSSVDLPMKRRSKDKIRSMRNMIEKKANMVRHCKYTHRSSTKALESLLCDNCTEECRVISTAMATIGNGGNGSSSLDDPAMACYFCDKKTEIDDLQTKLHVREVSISGLEGTIEIQNQILTDLRNDLEKCQSCPPPPVEDTSTPTPPLSPEVNPPQPCTPAPSSPSPEAKQQERKIKQLEREIKILNKTMETKETKLNDLVTMLQNRLDAKEREVKRLVLALKERKKHITTLKSELKKLRNNVTEAESARSD